MTQGKLLAVRSCMIGKASLSAFAPGHFIHWKVRAYSVCWCSEGKLLLAAHMGMADTCA